MTGDELAMNPRLFKRNHRCVRVRGGHDSTAPITENLTGDEHLLVKHHASMVARGNTV